MADVFKFGRGARRQEETIPAALREFIDAAIVPALVKEYLAEIGSRVLTIFALSDLCQSFLETPQRKVDHLAAKYVHLETRQELCFQDTHGHPEQITGSEKGENRRGN